MARKLLPDGPWSSYRNHDGTVWGVIYRNASRGYSFGLKTREDAALLAAQFNALARERERGSGK